MAESALNFIGQALKRASTDTANLKLPKLSKEERSELLQLFPRLNSTM